MHKTIAFNRPWLPASSSPGGSQPPPPADNTADDNKPSGIIKRNAKKMVSENAVIVFGQKGCFMCHVVRLLLLGHGVNPLIVEVEEAEEAAVIGELSDSSGLVQFPAVFLGGRLFGGLERLVATHLSGELVPLLRQAGALWL
ncbi:glutaredoxin-C9-like [Impatiens glandulifera]|uniref:glutaredoxin-C9-like n=1 Tax=Impatiens glandulifera TaxID=253017 RepID=UPI001FB1061F|nr:glutaredoxin-C9-like [Impatiens glandulifera]